MAFRSRFLTKIIFIALFWACPASLLAVTPPIPAQPSQYVVDLAGVLDAGTQARLNTRLKDLETETTAQMVVLTINSLEGEPIESFSHQTAVKWGIGQKGKDNGVLFTVAVKDHKYRIEVGYGLESTLPDSLVGSLGREYLVPNFRKGDYAAGIVAVVTEVINKLSQVTSAPDANQPATPAATVAPTPPGDGKTPPQLILLAIIIFVIILLPAIALILPRILGAKKRDSHVGFWGGGSSGGSSWGSSDSSSFSGGGGDFGGGGASGDW
ncbi:MAG: TPM domain-containing protein [Desulfobaccales bacterium]